MSTDVMQDTCEHGMSAALCAGPGHYPADDRSYYPAATMGEAHAEWHRNAGVPMGTPGCPQDACHPIEDWDEEDYEPVSDEELAARNGTGFPPAPVDETPWWNVELCGDEPPF